MSELMKQQGSEMQRLDPQPSTLGPSRRLCLLIVEGDKEFEELHAIEDEVSRLLRKVIYSLTKPR